MKVFHQRLEECLGAFIWQPEFKGRAADDTSDLSVMDVTDVREQMVFDLEIQASDVPRKPSAFIAKISCR